MIVRGQEPEDCLNHALTTRSGFKSSRLRTTTSPSRAVRRRMAGSPISTSTSAILVARYGTAPAKAAQRKQIWTISCDVSRRPSVWSPIGTGASLRIGCEPRRPGQSRHQRHSTLLAMLCSASSPSVPPRMLYTTGLTDDPLARQRMRRETTLPSGWILAGPGFPRISRSFDELGGLYCFALFPFDAFNLIKDGRPLGSTVDEERNDAAKRLDSRKSRLPAHF